MPRSTTLSPNSGSMTPSMAPRTASSEGLFTGQWYRCPGPPNPDSVARVDRLGVFKALGDDTRYAIYQELARAPGALGTSELSRRLGLHPNTVRPQLERLREAGLVEMRADGQGTVGRPEHRWSVAAAGPLAGVEPSGFRLLAHMLADTAARAGVAEEDLRAVGAGRGGESPVAGDARTCLNSFVEQMSSLGFDPSVEGFDPSVEGP